MSETRHPPRLSELGTDLLHLTRWQLIRAIAWPFAAFAAYWVFAAFGLWIPAVLSLIVLSFVTYGSTSHDLVHGTLGLQRRTNDVLLAVIEAISLRSGHAYQAAHLHHHARFPHEDDVEAQAARMSLARTLLEGVVLQARIVRWALWHAHSRRNWILGETLAVLTIVLGAVAALPWTIAPAVYVMLMIAGSWSIPLITSKIPHDAEAPDRLHQTRVFRGPLARIIAFDHLYHWEHHFYPAVPHQNWPRLARRLDPYLEELKIEPIGRRTKEQPAVAQRSPVRRGATRIRRPFRPPEPSTALPGPSR
jgi:beta-carotene hydroxylase